MIAIAIQLLALTTTAVFGVDDTPGNVIGKSSSDGDLGETYLRSEISGSSININNDGLSQDADTVDDVSNIRQRRQPFLLKLLGLQPQNSGQSGGWGDQGGEQSDGQGSGFWQAVGSGFSSFLGNIFGGQG